MKSTSPKAPTQGALIDLDSMPNAQGEGTQQPSEVQSSFVSEPFDTSIKK
jgi:hypothetical protein